MSDVHFGVGRMMEAYADGMAFPTRVFRAADEAEALSWLQG